MSVIAIVQARMGSKRFPGKSMFPFNGKPSLQHLLDSVMQVLPKENIHLASSVQKENDIIEQFALENSFLIHRGDEKNVASRFLEILENQPCDYFIRLNGDSPLMDCQAIEKAIQYAHAEIDLVSTVPGRKFPAGMNVELVKKSTFISAYNLFSSNDHFEHVTKYFYENKTKFNIVTLQCPVGDVQKFNFCFDTKEDRRKIEKIFSQLEKAHYQYSLEEKCAIYKRILCCIK